MTAKSGHRHHSTGDEQRRLAVALLEHSLTPVQQFAYTRGKNATDCSMIIDAMDMMHSRRFDGFCLVSSDSDFTRAGSEAVKPGLAPRPGVTTPAAAAATGAPPVGEGLPLELIRQAVKEASDDSGWAHLGSVGSYLNKIRPDFDSRSYGAAKLSDLLRGQSRHFLIEDRGAPGATSKPVYVRLK